MRREVACIACGQVMTGTPNWNGTAYHVAPHRKPNGEPCNGHIYGTHRPTEQDQ